ncbi:hypothetical protein IWW36_000693 [Coemansia brasiliensis]|uniref:Uncharacterized protein n=1 Tax=Coemansia brasiliensis TaxID=2650707 RepID=A0A9W8M1J0_9FUNG|nr:hypothetical protein IWW36_000693 [Coemansia brasiliensis]
MELNIFVPEYVDTTIMDKCFLDRVSTFTPIQSGSFSPEEKLKALQKFIVLEKDHFMVFLRGGEPFKCSYQSRNAIMYEIRYGCWWKSFDMKFPSENGLRLVKQPPIHYFVRSDDSDSLHLNNATEDNTIVEYFDNDGDVDLESFAKIVKSKPHCVQKYFIINSGSEYRAVETDNVANTYVFSSRLKHRIVDTLASGKATIETFIEEDKHLEEKLAKPERLPGFKLRDADGNVISDGEPFALQILGDREGYESDELPKKLSKGERLFYGKDWLTIGFYIHENQDNFLYGHPDGGVYFTCETIDDIVYLKCGDSYLYNNLERPFNSISIGSAVPTKEQRIQIHYNDDGDIMLSGWGDRIYAMCEWVKFSCGSIGFNPSEEQLRWESPMELRIVRV